VRGPACVIPFFRDQLLLPALACFYWPAFIGLLALVAGIGRLC